MKNKVQYLPTVITMANLFCGFSAILLLSVQKYESAVWIIIAAAIFDSLDGRVARASGQSSDFGLQMDSLSDVTSFGIAPAFLVYQYYFKSLGLVGILLSFLPLSFAALRLARFNVTSDPHIKSHSYIGLASPMAAISIASIVLLHIQTQMQIVLLLLFVMTPIISLLMMSTIKYSGFPSFSVSSGPANLIKLFLIVIAIVTFPFYPYYTLFSFMMLYMLSGPLDFWITPHLFPKAIATRDHDNFF